MLQAGFRAQESPLLVLSPLSSLGILPQLLLLLLTPASTFFSKKVSRTPGEVIHPILLVALG